MTSLRKYEANRANALKSTGPRSAKGLRTASLNATSHGLSVPVDPNFLDPTAERVASLIALDGIGSDESRELAGKIIDFERNMEQQRLLFMPPTPISSSNNANEQVGTEKEVCELDKFVEDFQSGRLITEKAPRGAKGANRLMVKAILSWRKFQKSQQMLFESGQAKAIPSERYLLRAINQLIKGLKRL